MTSFSGYGKKMKKTDLTKHKKFMQEAIKEAKKSGKKGGIPIGAVLVKEGSIIARGHNRRIQKNSAILHAEIDCLENAGRLKAEDYKKTVLYSTLSPCDMCTGAILLYKIPIVVIGENSTFKGPEDYARRKGVKMTNLNMAECKNMMQEFIKDNPDLWNEDIGE